MKKRILLIGILTVVIIVISGFGALLFNPPAPQSDIVIDLQLDKENRCLMPKTQVR